MLDAIFYSAGVVLGIVVAVYFYFFFARYAKIFKKLTKKESTKKQNIFFKIIQLLLSVGLGTIMVFISYTPALVVGHIFAFLLIFDCIFAVIKLICRHHKKALDVANVIHYSRVLPILTVVALLIYGFINMGIIYRTDYAFSSTKIHQDGGYKIALITDAHYDTVQDVEVFKDAIAKLSQSKPDVVVLGGDIVDESTSKEAMQECFEILGSIDTTYGIYFVYGNHDTQMYAPNNRTYTDEELVNAITANGIKIMVDQIEIINDDLMLIGRQDPSNVDGERATIQSITAGYNLDDYYTVVLDHKPEKAIFEENAALGIDLQLSGHTHGGQIFPTGVFLSMIGTPNYGQYTVDDFTAIVSSGITGWGYTFRTESICEYVIVSVL